MEEFSRMVDPTCFLEAWKSFNGASQSGYTYSDVVCTSTDYTDNIVDNNSGWTVDAWDFK